MKNIISALFLISLFFVTFSIKIKNPFVVKPDSLSYNGSDNVFYLDLPYENYASYKAPTRSIGGKPATTIKTVFHKVKFNPWTLKIDTSDFTHSSSTGYINHYTAKPDKVPYGTAFGCQSSNNADGEAKIDLRGTPYAVKDSFTHRGWQSNGSVNVSHNGQVIVLRGGGYCGWIAPTSATNEVQAHEGGEYIQLVLLEENSDIVKDDNGNHYLVLKERNYSSYKLPSRKPWGNSDSDLTVEWKKVRINPDTLAIHSGDTTYTTSSGKVSHIAGHFTNNAFGAAQGCQSANNADATAKIDLRGTNYRIKNDFKFKTGGWLPAGDVTFSDNRQVAIITGGGYCGWNGLLDGGEAYTGGWVDGFLEKMN